jgi:hypothetical protein
MSDNEMAGIAPTTRRRDDRDRSVESLQIANARGPGNLDVPALRRLLEFPKEDADIVLRHVFDAINTALAGLQPDAPPRFVNCPSCHAPLEAPAPEIQIEQLREWQHQHDVYYQWSPRELRLLLEHLQPGDVIVPKFAHSCAIRKPNGQLVEYKRTAKEEA